MIMSNLSQLKSLYVTLIAAYETSLSSASDIVSYNVDGQAVTRNRKGLLEEILMLQQAIGNEEPFEIQSTGSF
jgi:hypothetical protein